MYAHVENPVKHSWPKAISDRRRQEQRSGWSGIGCGKEFGDCWTPNQGVADSANLPDPDVIAAEIAEDLQAALDQFTQIAADLKQ